jgi:hypothetical protein
VNEAVDALLPARGILPLVMLQQNTQPEAYIGRLYPLNGKLPHLTLGVNADLGMTGDFVGDLVTGSSGDIFAKGMPFLPAFGLDLRLGGAYLPFDVGFALLYTGKGMDMTAVLGPLFTSFGMEKVDGVAMEFTIVAADLRYRILKGGTGFALGPDRGEPEGDKWYIPDLSLGVGVSYYALDITGTGSQDYEYNSSNIFPLALDIGVGFLGGSVNGSLQVSRAIGFWVPYAGIRAGVYHSQVSANVRAAVDLTSVDAGSMNIRSTKSVPRGRTWEGGASVFFGSGFNLPFSQINLGFGWQPGAEALSASLSLRAKL